MFWEKNLKLSWANSKEISNLSGILFSVNFPLTLIILRQFLREREQKTKKRLVHLFGTKSKTYLKMSFCLLSDVLSAWDEFKIEGELKNPMVNYFSLSWKWSWIWIPISKGTAVTSCQIKSFDPKVTWMLISASLTYLGNIILIERPKRKQNWIRVSEPFQWEKEVFRYQWLIGPEIMKSVLW